MQAFATFLFARSNLPELPNVRTGNERLTRTNQYDSLYGLFRLRLVDRFDDPLRHARTECVDWGIIHRDEADLTVLYKRN